MPERSPPAPDNAAGTGATEKLATAIEAVPPPDTLVQGGQEQPADGITEDRVRPADTYADLWDRIRAGFRLPHVDDPLVTVHEHWFADNPEFLARTVARARPYLYFIVREVEKRNMPLEIALLPAIESAYQPHAYSRAKAMGLWQLIAPTARRYGVKINWWYDGRRDVLSSTRAALDYLQKLHDQFEGNWYLALAAYNAGEAEIQRQIDYNRRHGKPADYRHLRLRAETRNYVPTLIAFVEIVADPAAYGIALATIANEPYFAVVDTGSQIDLNVVARLAATPVDALYGINPGLTRSATPPGGPHRVLVPVNNEIALIEGLTHLPREARIRWHHYRVRRGDTLGRIARRYGVTVKEVRGANKLHGNLIHAGRDLVIPISRGLRDAKRERTVVKQLARRQLPGRTRVKHHVRKGESLWSIAHRYGVRVRQIAKWNTLSTVDDLHIDQTLDIWMSAGVD